MEITIRSALESDASFINAASKHLGYSELTNSEAQKKLTRLLNSTSDEVYVAEVDNNIIGWIHLFFARRLASADFREIGGLVVSPQFRGRGVGRRLVEHATSMHGGKVRVRCNEKRVDSHQFYRALGFRDTKAQNVFENNDPGT